MRHLLAALLGAFTATACPAYGQKAIIVVRHAEKDVAANVPDLDVPLTDAGRERAQLLAQMLKDSKIKAVYTSKHKRTQQTAEPLKTALGLMMQPAPIAADDPKLFATKVKADAVANHADDVVLVVAHTNSIPAVLNLYDPGLAATIGEEEFDRVFVLVPLGPGKASLARLRYQRGG